MSIWRQLMQDLPLLNTGFIPVATQKQILRHGVEDMLLNDCAQIVICLTQGDQVSLRKIFEYLQQTVNI